MLLRRSSDALVQVYAIHTSRTCTATMHVGLLPLLGASLKQTENRMHHATCVITRFVDWQMPLNRAMGSCNNALLVQHGNIDCVTAPSCRLRRLPL